MSCGDAPFLKCVSTGLAAGGLYPLLARAAAENGGHPSRRDRTHFPAKAKHLIFVFLTGGFSHVDTFDPKPRLKTDHGKTVPGRDLREAADRRTSSSARRSPSSRGVPPG